MRDCDRSRFSMVVYSTFLSDRAKCSFSYPSSCRVHIIVCVAKIVRKPFTSLERRKEMWHQ